jgi:hypothetical protein
MEGQYGCSWTVQYWNLSLSVWIAPSLQIPPIHLYWIELQANGGLIWLLLDCSVSTSSLVRSVWTSMAKAPYKSLCPCWIELEANRGLMLSQLDCSGSKSKRVSANRTTFDRSDQAWPKHHTNPTHLSILDQMAGQRKADLAIVGLFSIEIKACQCESHQVRSVWPSMARAPYKSIAWLCYCCRFPIGK